MILTLLFDPVGTMCLLSGFMGLKFCLLFSGKFEQGNSVANDVMCLLIHIYVRPELHQTDSTNAWLDPLDLDPSFYSLDTTAPSLEFGALTHLIVSIYLTQPPAPMWAQDGLSIWYPSLTPFLAIKYSIYWTSELH